MNRPLPLDGLRVVEFVHMVMGPSCGLILADLGADVVKVEPAPRGDNTRRLVASGAGFFPAYNRNKRSLALDLKSAAGKEIVRRLIARADVVTENFRPGAMDAMGLGHAELSARHPRLIYCSLKGFLAGPYEHRTALDEVVQMMGGLAYMTGPEGRPLRAGASVNDVMGGMFAAIGILAAIEERHRTGKGQHVKAGLFENCAFLVGQHIAQYMATGTPALPMAVRQPAWGVYDVFATADGEQLFVAVVTDTQWGPFCEAFELDELMRDEWLRTNIDRVKARERIIPRIAAAMATLAKPELIARCERIGIPFAPIARPQDLLDDPHLNATGGFVDLTTLEGRALRVPSLPLDMDGRRSAARHDLPAIGEHSRAILAELGYDGGEIERLLASGVAVETSRQRRTI